MPGLYPLLLHFCSRVVRVWNRPLHSNSQIFFQHIYIHCLLSARHTCTHSLSYHTTDQADRIYINIEMLAWNSLRRIFFFLNKKTNLNFLYRRGFCLIWLQSKLCVFMHVHFSINKISHQGIRIDISFMLSIKHREIHISVSSHVVARNKLLEVLLIQWLFMFHGKQKIE